MPLPGYLGDPGVEHTVTGSPTGNNIFRVEGPAGSFGANQACEGVTDGSCVQTDLFSIVGKHAQTSGVQTMRAVRTDHDDASSDYLEVFATSRPGQKIMLSGAGIGTTQMKGVTTGRGDLYYAKVLVPGIAPTEVTATNQTDGTSWKSPVTDLVDVTAARYDLESGLLTVDARSSVAADVTLTAVPGGLLSDGTLTVPMASPPLNIVVKSSAGGSDTEPVRLIGADFESVAVTAAASANPTNAIPGQAVLLDSTGSSGDITSYQWTQIAGTPVTLSGANTEVASFSAPAAAGALTFRLTVAGAGGLTTDTADITVNVAAGQAPIANAGANQAAIVGSNVTLDGTASQFATGYQWTQTGGPAVTLNGSATSIASFLMPDTTPTNPLIFQLKATAGTQFSTATVTISKVNEVVTITRAELRTRNGQLRVEGSTNLFSLPNVVSIYASDGVAGTHRTNAIGTIIADPNTRDLRLPCRQRCHPARRRHPPRHLHQPRRSPRERGGRHPELTRSTGQIDRGVGRFRPARPPGPTPGRSRHVRRKQRPGVTNQRGHRQPTVTSFRCPGHCWLDRYLASSGRSDGRKCHRRHLSHHR